MKACKTVWALVLGLLSTNVAVYGQSNGPVSDDFNETSINTSLWTQMDAGGASGTSFGTFQTVGAGTGDAHLQITVPEGDDHDAYSFNGAVQLMQPVGDTDFEVEVKFDSLPSQAYQEEGIMVLDASGVGLRIDAAQDYGQPTLRQWIGGGIGSGAASQIQSVPMSDIPTPSDSAGTIYLRLQRQGSTWTTWSSVDGTTWTQRATFQSDLVPAQIGIEAGNYDVTGQNAAPAFTVLVDYFFNMASPIIHEDGNTANHPPSVAITSPTENALLPANQDLTVGIDASDLDGTITKVDLFEGGTNLIGTATASPFEITVSQVPAGTYTITATATDDQGAQTTSDPVKVFVVHSTGAIVSDDFSSPTIDTSKWAVVDPVGDGQFSIVGAGSGDSDLQMVVPGGTAHDAWQQNDSLRLMQLVTNQDFTVEAKFDSLPSEAAQFEGILVEDTNGTSLRFDAGLTRGYGYIDAWVGQGINTSSAGQVAVQTIADIPQPPAGLHVGTVYLRVQKQGTQWTTWTSPDGANWTQNASFENDIEVARIGVFAGNAFSPPPGFNSLVDYFMNVDAPISPEDGSPNSPPVVTLTSPTDGAQFGGTDTVNLSADASESNGSVAKVEFYTWVSGMAEPQLIATATSSPFTAQWVSPGPGNRYVFAKATADAGATAYSPIVAIEAFSGPNGEVLSDDFNALSVNQGIWQMVDPVGDVTYSIDGAFTGDSHLLINVPGGGASHDPWASNGAAQLLQTVQSQPFEVVAKFDSVPALKYQEEGFMVTDPDGNFLRFNVESDGSAQLQAFIAQIMGGSPTTILGLTPVTDVPLPTNGNVGTIYLKLNWDGLYWSFSTSPDGTSWTEQNAFPLDWTVAQVGLYAGNAGSPVPAYTARVDYFENTAAPFTTEDGEVYPRLEIARADSQIVISWPSTTGTAGFGLEVTPSLGAPNWSAVTTAPVVTGGQNTVTLPVGSGNNFYRLKK